MAFKVSDNLLPIYLLSLIHLCLFNHPALEWKCPAEVLDAPLKGKLPRGWVLLYSLVFIKHLEQALGRCLTIFF